MKWKRKEAGVYESGDYMVAGAGTSWTLFYEGHEAAQGRSKKALQEMAESHAPMKKATKRRAPGKKMKDMTAEDIPRAVDKSEGPVSLDSALRSIRLSLDGLAHSNNATAAALREMAAQNEAMAKTMQEMIKYLKAKEIK